MTSSPEVKQNLFPIRIGVTGKVVVSAVNVEGVVTLTFSHVLISSPSHWLIVRSSFVYRNQPMYLNHINQTGTELNE